MTIELRYGRGTLGVTPPAGCVPRVIAKQAMPVLGDPSPAVDQALAFMGHPRATNCVLDGNPLHEE